MSEQVNFVIEQYDSEELAETNELIGDMLINANIENKRLKAENTKLRKLVRDMWRFTGTACKKYPKLFDQSAQGGQMVQLNMIDAFEQRVRELGIEVEDA